MSIPYSNFQSWPIYGACFHVGPHGPGCPGWPYDPAAQQTTHPVITSTTTNWAVSPRTPDYIPEK